MEGNIKWQRETKKVTSSGGFENRIRLKIPKQRGMEISYNKYESSCDRKKDYGDKWSLEWNKRVIKSYLWQKSNLMCSNAS